MSDLVSPVGTSLELESQTIESNKDSLASCIEESLGSEIRVSGVVAVVGLVDECMVCLGQQHVGRKEQAAVVVVEG